MIYLRLCYVYKAFITEQHDNIATLHKYLLFAITF